MNNINLTLTNITIDELNHILAGLQELPAKICNPLSKKLVDQAEAQLNPPVNSEHPEISQVA